MKLQPIRDTQLWTLNEVLRVFDSVVNRFHNGHRKPSAYSEIEIIESESLDKIAIFWVCWRRFDGNIHQTLREPLT